MNIRDKILNYVINSNRINESINNIVTDKRLLEDFKQHFYLELLKVDNNKLIKSYIGGYIDWMCIKIMTNQWRSKSSSFYRLYKRDKTSDFEMVDTPQEDLDEVLEYKYYEDILKRKKDKWLNKIYHETLFSLYFKDGKTLKQINELTGINERTALYSINCSLKYIRKKIK